MIFIVIFFEIALKISIKLYAANKLLHIEVCNKIAAVP